jgi:uncharacterized protein with NAD-binding domain and iron-sulfur cluster
MADGTTVSWTPTTATYGSPGFDAVPPGGTGTAKLDRFDTLQVRAGSFEDLSGTLVSADKPIWVVGASNCALVPTGLFFCDHLQEQMLPLDYWGKQAVQLWMEPTLAGLGWRHPSPILDAYDDPFNTWADMSFLLPREAWRGARRPGALAYLVGPLHEHAPPPRLDAPSPGFQDRHVDAVRERARRWLDRAAPGIWPATARGGAAPGFDAATLFAETDLPPDARLAEQYARANVAGSERYVQSPAGSTRHRLFTAGCGVEGLYPVGDWLNTGINSGDVEAATISGLQAARAIAGDARAIVGEGDGQHRHAIDRRVARPAHPAH